MCEPIKRSGWIEMCPPTSICETLHCRGSWLLVAGPDKSVWSLMFVRDRGWVHNCREARGHDIRLPAISSSNTVRVTASATHTHTPAEKNISRGSHALPFFRLLYRVFGKWFQSPKFNIDRKCCVKCPQMPFSTRRAGYRMPAVTILRETAHRCAWT